MPFKHFMDLVVLYAKLTSRSKKNQALIAG